MERFGIMPAKRPDESCNYASIGYNAENGQANQQTKKTLKDAIRQSGISRYAISQATGVTESSLSRFVAGKHDLCLDAADRLLQLFEIELRQKGKKKKRS